MIKTESKIKGPTRRNLLWFTLYLLELKQINNIKYRQCKLGSERKSMTYTRGPNC